MTYWTWKGALATGKVMTIQPFRSHQQVQRKDGYVYDGWTSYKLGRDAFETEAEARAAAMCERDKKIASLKRQITKLEKMTFPAKEVGDA